MPRSSVASPLTRMSPVILPWVLRPAMTSIRVVLPAPLWQQTSNQTILQSAASTEIHRCIKNDYQTARMVCFDGIAGIVEVRDEK